MERKTFIFPTINLILIQLFLNCVQCAKLFNAISVEDVDTVSNISNFSSDNVNIESTEPSADHVCFFTSTPVICSLIAIIITYLIWYIYSAIFVNPRGGLRWRPFQTMSCWSSVQCYLSSQVIITDPMSINNNRNYIIANVPHGVWSVAALVNYLYVRSGFRERFPRFRMQWIVNRRVMQMHLLIFRNSEKIDHLVSMATVVHEVSR